MKTIFKSLLYFSFAGLILTGCAKNDDFSVPSVNCEEPNIKTNFTIDNLYSVLKEDPKAIIPYDKDHTIAGIVVSSDQGGNFYQQLIIVDETTQKAVTIKADVKGAFALYPVGSQVFIKLKGTNMQYANRMITIGAGIYTSSGGSQYPDAITGAKLRSNIFKSCKVIEGDKFDKEFNHRVTLKEAASDAYIGKLITITDVQFKKEFWGKPFWDKDNLVSEKNKATNNYIESKQNDVTSKVFFRAVEQSNGFKDELVPNKSGTMTGVMTAYVPFVGDTEYQFYPRTMADLKLDQAAFGGDGGPEEVLPQHEIKLTGALAWLGGDFKDFNAFMGTLEEYQGVKLKDYAKEAKGQGWEGTDALAIKGKPTANDFIFTVIDNKVPADAESITFLLKGKATGGKSISINVYNEDGKTYETAFNLGNVGADDITLDKAVIDANNKYLNNYNGSINTKGRWIKVTLNLKGIKYNTSAKGKFFAFKVGTGGDYDILVDEFRVVGGKDGGTDPEIPSGDKMKILGKEGAFKDLITTTEQGIKVTEEKGNAIKIEGTSTNNGAGFSIGDIAVPASAKNIVFYVTGESTPGGKDSDRGTFVVNTHDAAKLILANYSVKNFLANGKSGEIVVPGVNDNKNDYVGSIKTNGKVKVILPLKDISLNNTGIGGFLQFRFASGGKFSVTIDNISFE